MKIILFSFLVLFFCVFPENSMEMMQESESVFTEATPDASAESYDTLSQVQENANSMATDAMQEPQSFE